MKATNSRKLVMTLGGILIATVAAGCFGGNPGYYASSSGYYSSYSSYGSSYPYSGYREGYSVAPRERVEARPETQHATVDRDKISMRDSQPARTE
jgi:hypothetical protein